MPQVNLEPEPASSVIMEHAPNPLLGLYGAIRRPLQPNQHSYFVFKEKPDLQHFVELFEGNLLNEKGHAQVVSIKDLGQVCFALGFIVFVDGVLDLLVGGPSGTHVLR